MKNKNLSKLNKIKIYKTLIRPVITYAKEATIINKMKEEELKIVNRNIMKINIGTTLLPERERRPNKN